MFKLQASERLIRWRNFRKSLDKMPFDAAVQSTCELWEHCSFSPYYLDPDNVESWPDPWTLITENWYCDIAKALGMIYTIKFTIHNPDVELRIYKDKITHYDYNLVWINNGEHILNLLPGEVGAKSQIDQSWTLWKTFKSTDLKLHNY